VVAPYEADAQIAYLFRTGAVTAVIAEDSDMLAFGCQRVRHPPLFPPTHIHTHIHTCTHTCIHTCSFT
jgi:hypothetical protein